MLRQILRRGRLSFPVMFLGVLAMASAMLYAGPVLADGGGTPVYGYRCVTNKLQNAYTHMADRKVKFYVKKDIAIGWWTMYTSPLIAMGDKNCYKSDADGYMVEVFVVSNNVEYRMCAETNTKRDDDFYADGVNHCTKY